MISGILSFAFISNAMEDFILMFNILLIFGYIFEQASCNCVSVLNCAMVSFAFVFYIWLKVFI